MVIDRSCRIFLIRWCKIYIYNRWRRTITAQIKWKQISFDLQDYFEGLPVGSDEEDDVMSGTHSYDYYLGDNVTYNGQTYVIIDDEDNLPHS